MIQSNAFIVIYKKESTLNEQFERNSKAPKRISLASSERCRKRRRSPLVLDEHVSMRKTKKILRWSTITIHEFGIGLGRSSVPEKGGPSIGLSEKLEFTWTTKVGEMAECVEGIHRFTSKERVQLLESSGVSEGMILRFARETNIINFSRKQTLLEVIDANRPRDSNESSGARPNRLATLVLLRSFRDIK